MALTILTWYPSGVSGTNAGPNDESPVNYTIRFYDEDTRNLYTGTPYTSVCHCKISPVEETEVDPSCVVPQPVSRPLMRGTLAWPGTPPVCPVVLQASASHLDLGRAPYAVYGVKYIDLVSLWPVFAASNYILYFMR